MEVKTVKVKKPESTNIIIAQSHFIKTVEDVYEALVGACPGIKFGLAFSESSGACLVRSEGNDETLKKLAVENTLAIGAGHSLIIMLENAFPINVLNAIKAVPEVCSVFCATANSVEVVIAESGQGRGIIGVIDGVSPKGVEAEKDIAWRKEFLREIGYKR
ncbi:MAG: adenosine-specific kinase [Candidatus Omnitrophota bacterium]